ncbi:TIGR00266 family protein [Leptolyngbya sp. FACHB-711]|uniref:TIGR00266 family protein n=1 Tax=unclassified Leptolyngbya TaxID=2650499 RepID=UPI0016821F47|nr:TIGR00266 family protein [Leptolyngbya sp. FACHB-711]MBD1850028.1 TIGR00266 family protein [Cyanobacteria bacterium FACHB-502]MBD2025402.1 TIGR00266 family protein [Leptolyngbya sp. FACHB-711]
MKLDILHRPDSAIAKINMAPREEIIAEAGAMVAMSASLDVNTTLRKGKGGGVLGGLKRIVTGESLFLSVFRSGNTPGEIYLAPKMMGDIVAYTLSGTDLVIQSTSYLASTGNVSVDLGFQGFKSIFSGEAIFWLTASGTGLVLLNSFGSIYEVDVDGEYIVDTGNIVAFEKTLSFSITKPGSSWLGALMGGEGFVCRFKGKGKLYCQTHNPRTFGQLIGSQLPPR